jgi:Fe2+ or Zn2+ uptake regulation protein
LTGALPLTLSAPATATVAEDLPARSRPEWQLYFVTCPLIDDGKQNLQNLTGRRRPDGRRTTAMNPADPAGRLRRAKLRATFSWLRVLDALLENPGFLRADEIHDQLFARKIPVDIGAVCRALREMRGAGIVLSLQDAGYAPRYRLRPETAPPLRLVCRDSGGRGGRLVFSDPELHARILAAAARQGLNLKGRGFDLQVRPEQHDAAPPAAAVRHPRNTCANSRWIADGHSP